ncbi:MAG: ammonia channel protein, partial [Pseudorhodoplanes sp.]
LAGLVDGNPGQVLTQLYGIGVTILWVGIMTFILLKIIGLMVLLRVGQQQEVEGLDITQHGESLQ